MSGLAFTGDMARLQQAISESHDLVVRRGTVVAALNLRTGERVLQLGCGGGYFAREAAQCVGPTGKVCAIDISPTRARRRRTAVPGSTGSNAAPRIFPHHPTVTRNSTSYLRCRRSSI